jgi:molybdopterin synthase catalytic subunit/molybdopterin converting factor small subunit
MQVQVRLFAALRERAGGSGELEVELPDGARVSDALERLGYLTDGVPVVMAVNREYADEAHALHPGDELALIPPVSGGAPDTIHIRLTSEPLAVERLRERVRDPLAGAVIVFEGVTREVPQLDYEAYGEMAEREIAAIASDALARNGLCAVAVEHRVGPVPLSEASVAIAVSAPHRTEAFAGARQIIDELKARAPIWKKEEGRWVAGSTPTAKR